jgi:hypothetical protein
MVSPTVRFQTVLKSVKLSNVSLMDWIPTLASPDMHDGSFVGFGVGLWVGWRVGLSVGSRVDGCSRLWCWFASCRCRCLAK